MGILLLLLRYKYLLTTPHFYETIKEAINRIYISTIDFISQDISIPPPLPIPTQHAKETIVTYFLGDISI